MQLKEIRKGILSCSHRHIAKAITLIESDLEPDQAQAEELLDNIYEKTGNSLRLGITGVPGVGKSSLIEKLGILILEKNPKAKVAVLAVDPSSPVRGGSILGDKTRMEALAVHPRAFVRPSASSCYLGGVAPRTAETSLILEAAGFDYIIIETVGVGQSEYLLSDMVDIFIMLQMPYAGDEIQGIKKGILELADLFVINKYDGDLKTAAQLSKNMFARVIQITHGHETIKPSILLTSTTENIGIDKLWNSILNFCEQQKKSGQFAVRRQAQIQKRLQEDLAWLLKSYMKHNSHFKNLSENLEKEIINLKISPTKAARKLLQNILGNN